MIKRRVAAVAVLAVSVAGCAQDASPPPANPPAAAAPQPKADERLPQDAADQLARDASFRVVKDLNALEAPSADTTRREPTFARATADGYDVRHEAKRLDVRDTRLVYDEKVGAMAEVPVDGTVNPAKVLQNKEWAKKAEALAHRDAVILVATHRRFREMFAEALRLPPLPADRLPLSAEVMWNRASFDYEMMRAGTPVASSVRAIRRPGTTGFVTYAGDESLQSLDEWACAGGRLQKESDQLLASAAAGQLLREYARARRGEPADSDATPPEHVGPRWLVTGLAELLGGVEVEREKLATLDGASLLHDRVVLAHVDAARRLRGASLWPLELLVGPDPSTPFPERLRHRSAVDLPDLTPPGTLFHARAWAFCHFLWNYDAGRYRNRFVEFVGRVLDGTGTSQGFATEIMGRPSRADWGDVEMEFEWYWKELLSRKPGRNPLTHEQREAPTDPPEGPVDNGFRELWAENHPAPAPRPK